MERSYAVEGYWPFPLDMLRRDDARAATPDDEALIARLTGETSDGGFGTAEKVRISLVMEAGEASRFRPNGHLLPQWRRWESFGWTVIDDAEVGEERLDDVRHQHLVEEAKEQDALRQSALAKLTPQERRALGFN
jgi:hypothetical protein